MYDELGLKKSYNYFVTKIMQWMFIGVGLTMITSIFMYVSGIVFHLGMSLFFISILASIIEIILVLFVLHKINNLNSKEAKKYFYVYSIVNGITLSLLLANIDPIITLLAFGITCAYFGLLYTITKYTTYRFEKIGTICLSALPILIIGYFVLFFINAPTLYYIVVLVDIVLFSGLTLYDMKKMRITYDECEQDYLESAALLSALNLYLDFINIFIDILILIADNN